MRRREDANHPKKALAKSERWHQTSGEARVQKTAEATKVRRADAAP